MVNELAGMGVTNIELSGNLHYYPGLTADLTGLKGEYGLNLLIHNYFPPPKADHFVLDLASSDPEIRRRTFELIENAVRLMDRIGVGLYSVHSGRTAYARPGVDDHRFIFDEERVEDRDKAVTTLQENIESVLKRFFEDERRLAIENAFPYYSPEKNFCLTATPSEIRDFLDYSRQFANLGFLFDLGHLEVSAAMLGFDKERFAHDILSEHADKIFEIHLSANDGSWDDHNINEDDSWQIELLKQHPDTLRHVPVVCEWCNNGDIKQICRRFHEIQAGLSMEESS